MLRRFSQQGLRGRGSSFPPAVAGKLRLPLVEGFEDLLPDALPPWIAFLICHAAPLDAPDRRHYHSAVVRPAVALLENEFLDLARGGRVGQFGHQRQIFGNLEFSQMVLQKALHFI